MTLSFAISWAAKCKPDLIIQLTFFQGRFYAFSVLSLYRRGYQS